MQRQDNLEFKASLGYSETPTQKGVSVYMCVLMHMYRQVGEVSNLLYGSLPSSLETGSL